MGPEDSEDDPYFYGWRDVREQSPAGEEQRRQIPLTYADLLSPEVGDFIAEDTIHRKVISDVFNILERRYKPEPSVAVWSDLKLVFHIPGLTTGPGPDICVVEGVEDRDRWRKSFHVGKEPGKVRLVIEVVSESSEKKDTEDLLRIYGPMGVEEYVAIQPLGNYPDGPYELMGWRRDPRTGLRPIVPDPEGRLHSRTTGLLFGTDEEGWGLNLWDEATGERQLTSDEEAAFQEERAEQAEAEIERLWARLREREGGSS